MSTIASVHFGLVLYMCWHSFECIHKHMTSVCLAMLCSPLWIRPLFQEEMRKIQHLNSSFSALKLEFQRSCPLLVYWTNTRRRQTVNSSLNSFQFAVLASFNQVSSLLRHFEWIQGSSHSAWYFAHALKCFYETTTSGYRYSKQQVVWPLCTILCVKSRTKFRLTLPCIWILPCFPFLSFFSNVFDIFFLINFLKNEGRVINR